MVVLGLGLRQVDQRRVPLAPHRGGAPRDDGRRTDRRRHRPAGWRREWRAVRVVSVKRGRSERTLATPLLLLLLRGHDLRLLLLLA